LIESNVPLLQQMIHRARKCRLMGSAALDMAYVACGRLDAYIEQGISLWDIAAGRILVESAGGSVDLRPRTDMKNKYSIIASNGVIGLKLLERSARASVTMCIRSAQIAHSYCAAGKHPIH